MIRIYLGLFILCFSNAVMSTGLIGSLELAKKHFKNEQYKDAFNIWLPLAKEGYADPMLRIGKMYAEGLGVKQDAKRAEFWINKAKEKGVEDIEESHPCGTSFGAGVIMDPKQMSSNECIKYGCTNDSYKAAHTIATLNSEGNTKTFVQHLVDSSYPRGSILLGMERDLMRISIYYTYDQHYPVNAIEKMLYQKCVAAKTSGEQLICEYDTATDKISCL